MVANSETVIDSISLILTCCLDERDYGGFISSLLRQM